MKHTILTILAILIATLPITAQHKYNRAGATIIYVNYDDTYSNYDTQFFTNYTPDSRYDINTIQTKHITPSWNRTTFTTSTDGKKTYKTVKHEEEVTQSLNNRNIGRQIIASLFNRKEDGAMDLLTIHYRGQYNATDADYLATVSTKRGAEALKETGELLINNSYIIVLDNQNTRFEKLENDTDQYIRGNTVGYIYKINWNEEMLYTIWDCWIDENTPEEEKPARRKAFDQLQIPLTLITTYATYQNSTNTNIEAARKTPSAYGNKSEATLKSEAAAKLIANGTNQCFQTFESKNEDLALKTSIYDTKPIRAKLGTKEGLQKDYTFFVYEKVQDASGNIKSKRVGVIRATNKIANNSRITTGDFEPSTFYQYAGRQVQKGQNITEKKKSRITLELGASLGNQTAFNYGIEYDGYSTRLTQYYLGIKGDIGGGGYNIGAYAGYGLRINNFQIFPLAGIFVDGLTNITKLEDEKTPSASFAQLALKTNINIYYPVQLYAQAGYNIKISENEYYIRYKGNRNPYGFNASAGIRFCF